MPNVFYDTNATGANNGSTRADAYTTLAAAITAAGAGGQIWASHLSNEAFGASTTITFAGTTGNRQKLISVNFSLGSGSSAPLSAHILDGATVRTTGGFALSLVGYFYARGMIFTSGTGAVSQSLNINANAAGHASFEGGELGVYGTSGGTINFGSTTLNAISNKVGLNNTKVHFKTTTSSIVLNSTFFEWRDTPTALNGTAIPTNLFTMGHAGIAIIEGVDLSAQVGNGSRFLVSGSQGKLITFNGCKLDSAILVGSFTNSAAPEVVVIDSTIADQKYDYRGTWRRTELYSMLDGSNDGVPFSYEMTTTATAVFDDPFESLPLAVYNSTVGSPITVTIEGIWSGGAVPQNDDFYMRVAYKDTSGSDLYQYVSTGLADIFATPANLTSSSVTWNASPPTPLKFKMSTTITPNEAGFIYVTICGAGGVAQTAWFNANVILS